MAIGCCKSSLYDDSLSGVVVAILFLLSLLNITTNFLSVICHMLISTLGTVFENALYSDDEDENMDTSRIVYLSKELRATDAK